jgi:PIN domain nuclease of toxin-antitoxin system
VADRYLLDTHVVLWAAADPERLGDDVLATISDPTAAVYASAVSIAEMAIKMAIGKLALPASPVAIVAELGFAVIPLTGDEADRLTTLPALHRDPFDRLLIAQAMVGDLVLVSADRDVLQYPDVRLLHT